MDFTHVENKDTYLSCVCKHQSGLHGDSVEEEGAVLCEMCDPRGLRGETWCQMACYCAASSKGALKVWEGNWGLKDKHLS